MKLNREMAQNIVARVAKIIQYSVNVMDDNGYIVASTNFNRLGQLHSGAVIALRENRVIEVDESLEQAWHHSVKQGINLPFSYLGVNLGVIGISGPPEQVRQYGELVKMAAEFIVEQAIHLNREQWVGRYKEEFIHQLIYEESDIHRLQETASLFNIDLTTPRVAIIIHLPEPTSELLQTLMNYWSLETANQDQLVAITAFNEITLLKPYKEALDDDYYLKILPSDLAIHSFKIVVGGYFELSNGLSLSYKTAKGTLNYLLKKHPKKRTAFFYDYRLPVLLSDFSTGWQAQEILKFYQKLQAQDPKGTLQKTLSCYFSNNCDLVHTSKKLFIHINTLRYRLEKIESITSLSINKFDEKLVLYLALLIDP